mgnify:CR=1 FL=1
MYDYFSRNNIPMNTAVHSQGGLLMMMALDWMEKGIFEQVEADNESAYKFQFNGAPVSRDDFIIAAKQAGAEPNEQDFHINPGDFVPIGLGQNFDNSAELLDATLKLYTLFDSKISPHSSYKCQGDFCDDKQAGRDDTRSPIAYKLRVLKPLQEVEFGLCL